jgi:hypothetical protein
MRASILSSSIARPEREMEGKLWGVAAMLAALGAVSCAYGPLAPEEEEPGITLCEDRTVRTKPFDHSIVSMRDTESIVHVPGDDNLWIGDDHSRAVFEFDRRTGHYRSRITARDIVEAFPEVRNCDDGDQDPLTKCSYTDEIEGVAYDPASRTLLVINTVNMPYLDPPVDKPAVFRLRKKQGRGRFRLVDWRELPGGRKYGPAVVIEGRLYLGIGADVVEYDIEQNRLVDTDDQGNLLPLLSIAEGKIVGMAFDGSSLWLLSNQETLIHVDWEAKATMGSYDVAPFGITKAKGLGFGAGEFFVVDGNEPNLIHVLRFGTRGRKAWWRGGGPSLSCA